MTGAAGRNPEIALPQRCTCLIRLDNMNWNTAFWRKWHRWVAFPATLFLTWAAITGLSLAFTEFFGADEALRERTRDLTSPVRAAAPAAAWEEPIGRAVTAVNASAPGAPIDK